MTHTQDEQFYPTKKAAAYLRLSPRTLERMRSEGRGPKYRKHGRYVFYHIDDMNAWSLAGERTSVAQDKAIRAANDNRKEIILDAANDNQPPPDAPARH